MDLARLIETLHREAHRQWAQNGDKAGISHSEFEYLRAIKEQEARKTDKQDHGQHLQDVVAEMGVRKASASAMVMKLEERGLVRRVPCRYDARAQHILLAADGEKLLLEGENIYKATAALLRARLDAGQRAALAALEAPQAGRPG